MDILVTNTEMDPRLWYGSKDEATEGDSLAMRYGVTCEAEGCETHCLIVRPDGSPLTAQRAQDIILSCGWTRLRPGEFLCELHSVSSENCNSRY